MAEIKYLGDETVNPLVTSAISLTADRVHVEQEAGEDACDDLWPTVGQVLGLGRVPGGVLSLAEGVPFPAADAELNQRSVIFYPHIVKDATITLLDANDVEQAYPIPATLHHVLRDLTPGRIYDLFAALKDDAPTLWQGPTPWTDNYTRGAALTRIRGRRVLASDHTKLYLGAFAATGENTTADFGGDLDGGVFGRRLLANEYHRRRRRVAMHWSSAGGQNYIEPPFQFGALPSPVNYYWPIAQWNVIGPQPEDFLANGVPCLDEEDLWRVQVLVLDAQDVMVSADIASAQFGSYGTPWADHRIFAIGLNVVQDLTVGGAYLCDGVGVLPTLTAMDDARQYVTVRTVAPIPRAGLHSLYPLIWGATGAGGSGNPVYGQVTSSRQFQSGLTAIVEN